MVPLPQLAKGVVLALFPYEKMDFELIRKWGTAALRNPDAVPRRSHPGRAMAFLAGRAAARFAFLEWGIEAWVEPVRKFGYLNVVDAKGQPLPGLFVNISHTEKIAVAVLAGSPIGVDVEAIDRDASRVIRRVATEEELARVRNGITVEGQPIRGDIPLWSSKEAVSKAVGLGIKFGMRHFRISLGETHPPYPVQLDLQGPQHLDCPAVILTRSESFLVAICSERGTLEAGVKRVLVKEQ